MRERLMPDRHGAWTQGEWDAADERDRETRLQRPALPSTSTNPARCTACGHWGHVKRDQCAACGLPFIAAPLVGVRRAS